MKTTITASLLLSFLGACSVSIPTYQHFATWSCATATPTTESNELTVECADPATSVRLAMRNTITAGELSIRLVDPQGVERHSEVVRSGEREATLSWPAAAGTWRLHVATTDCTGSWSARLTATDEPIRVEVNVSIDPPR